LREKEKEREAGGGRGKEGRGRETVYSKYIIKYNIEK